MDGVLVFSEFLGKHLCIIEGCLAINPFTDLIKGLQKRPEIEDLFKQYAKGATLTAEELCSFFHNEQEVFACFYS